MDNNLPELRDIHLPDADISWWPIAYGWWVILLGLVLAALMFEVFVYLRRKSKKRYALRLLDNVMSANIIAAAAQSSEILRRICVFKYPKATALFGQEWIAFLNSHAPKPLPKKAAELLLNAPYIGENSQTYSENDLRDLQKFCQSWIGENL